MKYRNTGIALISILLLSGCGIFLRNRKIVNGGIEKYDYDLPVILYPTSNTTSKKLIFILSGDGGWLEFEDGLAREFAQKGFYTVGFNSRNYFWKQRTPLELTRAMMLLMRTYSQKYNTSQVYFCGYSFGADVIPFVYNRLSPRAKRRVVSLQLLSPFASSAFMVHTADLLNIAGDDKEYKVQPEVERISIPIRCYYGENEKLKPLSEVKLSNFKISTLPGDHRYEVTAIDSIVSAYTP